jgi:hypothetical protein
LLGIQRQVPGGREKIRCLEASIQHQYISDGLDTGYIEEKSIGVYHAQIFTEWKMVHFGGNVFKTFLA